MLNAKSVGSGGFTSLFTAAASPSASRAERWLKEQLKRSAREGVFTITVELTPELAEMLLANNPENRTKSFKNKIPEYAKDIRDGQWRHNGETIIVAGSGELNDGQNRCEAVIAAGRSITTEMTFGVDRDTRRTVDIGIKRSIGQHLGMAGYQNAKLLGHAVAVILAFNKTQIFRLATTARPTTAEIMAWAEQNQTIQSSLITGRRTAKKFAQSAGLFAALHYVFAQKSAIDAERFFTSLEVGDGLAKNNPIYRLREQLSGDLVRKAKLPDHEIAARVIKAWNHFRNGRNVKFLRQITKGRSSEDFPIPE